MIKMQLAISLKYEVLDPRADFILNLHAAQTANQSVMDEHLQFSQPLQYELYEDTFYGTRYVRCQAEAGPLEVHYSATVEVDHQLEAPDTLQEVAITDIPIQYLRYLYPSRYCQSDLLQAFANQQFGHLPRGYARVKAVCDWVHGNLAYLPGSTNSMSAATDVIEQKAGVCRDFSHAMIALCRALNMPARFVTGVDYGSDPASGPHDFHAYVEVYLGDRWYVFEPTGISPRLGLIRLGTGRDAADVSFATVFGAINSWAPLIEIEALQDPASGIVLPQHSDQAVSTDA